MFRLICFLWWFSNRFKWCVSRSSGGKKGAALIVGFFVLVGGYDPLLFSHKKKKPRRRIGRKKEGRVFVKEISCFSGYRKKHLLCLACVFLWREVLDETVR